MSDVERKLTAARTQLILEKPFLGALVLRLPLVQATGSWCETSATDARSIYYNPGYIAPLTLAQVQFVLAHEALHCGLSHFARRTHRDINRWNIACDHAVNPMLLKDGLELPPGALYDETYTGLSAEEIYPLIKHDSDEKTLDQHLYDDPNADAQQPGDNHQSPAPGHDDAKQPGPASETENLQTPQVSKTSVQPIEPGRQPEQRSGDHHHSSPQSRQERDKDGDTGNRPGSRSGRPAPLSEQEKATLDTQWRQRLVAAAQQATLAGKMNGSVARFIERLMRSSVPWRNILARYMNGVSRVDYNMTRPSQRRSGEALLPSLYSRETNVLIALDTSGSIDQQELALFVAEVNAIKSLVNARITLLACDWRLDEDGPWTFEPWQQLVLPKTLQGGGGTDFTPVFDWMTTHRIQLDLVIYFTDAKGRFPAARPNVETLWLVKGAATVPWGQRIQLN